MLGKLLTAIGAAIAALALIAPVGQAAEPAPGFERFAGCPSPEEVPSVAACVRSEVTGGHFQMGSKNVPISKPIVLSGGVNTELGEFVYTSEGGLSKAQQEVPGGLVGLTGLDWLVNLLGLEALKVYAVTELAGTPQLGLETTTLPIKVRLVNPLLGSNCYVGSDSNPIVLNLTTGTTNPPPPNEPISGQAPEPHFENGVVVLKDGIFVDNAFAAPAAKGCQLLGFPLLNADLLVNAQSGLPSPAGTNETVQEFDLELAEAAIVYP